MSLAAFALRHGRALTVLAIAAAVGGALVAHQLPKGVYPEVVFPREQVVVELPGASVDTVLAAATRPIEAAMQSVPGLQVVRSRTIRGAAEISLFFDERTDMVETHGLVNARLAELRNSLPSDADLTASRVLPSGFPIISINVEGPLAPERLYELAAYTLRPALAGLPGAGPVTVQSSDVPELEVELDPTRLQATHLDVPSVADKLRTANHVQTVARIDEAHELTLGIVSGELRTPEDIYAVVVGGTSEAPVHVRDLGTVREGVTPRTSIVRVDGRPGAILNITRQPGGDILRLDAAVRARLDELKPTLPEGVVLRPVYEQADFVSDAVGAVRDAVIFGALFSVLVLALFLRDLRATLVAALALPLALGAALLALRALGQTLNLMTLGGLAVAVGLVIDDAVVVVEAVHKHLEAGLAPAEAARRGTDELFWPVVGTTATTVVVFLPLGLLGGVAGQFFSALSIALASAVVISLPVALFVLPSISALVLRPVPTRRDALAEYYRAALAWALRHRAFTLGALVLSLALGVVAFHFVSSDFLPEADEGAYVVDYFAPVGASLDDANALAGKIEDVLRETPDVVAFSRRLGAELGPPTATLASRGDVAVRLTRGERRGVDEIMDEQRKKLAARAPGMRVEFVQVLSDMLGDLQGAPEPIEVKIFGPDSTTLRELAGEAAPRIKDVPGLVDFFNGDEGCTPELLRHVEPERTARNGLTATDVADQLAAANLGEVATQVRKPDHLEDVRVRAVSSAPQQDWLVAHEGAVVPGAAVLADERRCPPAVALRENGRNMVHLTARLEGTSLGAAANDVRAKLTGSSLPQGYTWELGGLVEQQRESFAGLLMVLAVAIFGVAIVLLLQLRSFRRALAVLAAAPVALAASALVLAISQVTLNVSSMMGAIVLVGLVVKNGILLLDYALWNEEAGVAPEEALLRAAQARLRPILMTTLATLVALLPLVFGLGAGSALHRPLAIVVVFGLALSTAATLFVVPALALRRSTLAPSQLK